MHAWAQKQCHFREGMNLHPSRLLCSACFVSARASDSRSAFYLRSAVSANVILFLVPSHVGFLSLISYPLTQPVSSHCLDRLHPMSNFKLHTDRWKLRHHRLGALQMWCRNKLCLHCTYCRNQLRFIQYSSKTPSKHCESYPENGHPPFCPSVSSGGGVTA